MYEVYKYITHNVYLLYGMDNSVTDYYVLVKQYNLNFIHLYSPKPK